MWGARAKTSGLSRQLRSVTSCSVRRNHNELRMSGWTWNDDLNFEYIYRTIND